MCQVSEYRGNEYCTWNSVYLSHCRTRNVQKVQAHKGNASVCAGVLWLDVEQLVNRRKVEGSAQMCYVV
jgi:hypothetical protein